MNNEINMRQSIHKRVLALSVPFCIANGVFILPFKIGDEQVNFKITGVCHCIMLVTYVSLQVIFFILEFRVWKQLNQTNFVQQRVSKRHVATYFFLTNLYLMVHIWMMFFFSKGIIVSIFSNEQELNSDIYT